jgi:hypothetical protein
VPAHPLFALEDRLRDCSSARLPRGAHRRVRARADGDVALLLPLAATESRLRARCCPACCAASNTTSPRRAQHPAVRDRHRVH